MTPEAPPTHRPCRVCHTDLPAQGRGRPREYCGDVCAAYAKKLAQLKHAAFGVVLANPVDAATIIGDLNDLAQELRDYRRDHTGTRSKRR